jgi:hypothetical protein
MKKTIIILALVLSLLPLWAVFHKIGEFNTLNDANYLTIIGNTAYVAEGNGYDFSGLQIIDIADPEHPISVSFFPTTGTARSVSVYDSIAYVVESMDNADRLLLINVSNPQNPTLLGSYETEWYLSPVEVAGSIAYFTDGDLQIIDVSNPQNPILIGSYIIPSGYASTVELEGSIAYVGGDLGEDNAGLLFIDVSNPQNPTQLGSYITPNGINSIDVTGGIAYLACIDSLLIVDVSNPQNPSLLSAIIPQNAGDDFTYSSFVTVEDGIAYIANGISGIQIVDISEPQSPILLGSYDTQNYADRLAVAGGIVFIADYDGLQIVDVSNPQNAYLTGSYDTQGISGFISVEGNLVYLVDYSMYVSYPWPIPCSWWGLSIIDISNPQNPVLLGELDCPPQKVTISNSKAYMVWGTAERAGYMSIYDVSNPQNIFELGMFTYGPGLRDIKVVGNTAYVPYSGIDSGLLIIDVSDPQNPVLLGSYTTQGDALSVDVVGSIAYTTEVNWIDNTGSLQIIDVSNPQNPYLLGSIAILRYAHSIELNNNIAFVNVGNCIQIIDVSNPATPFLISTILPINASSSIGSFHIQNNLLFVSDNEWNEISVYNVGTPQSPVLIRRFPWNLNTADMFVVGDVLYTANGYYGLNILDLSMQDAEDVTQIPVFSFILQNNPNPFNSETTISYTLPSKGQVCLEIFNSKGQLVKRLLNESQPKGEHTFTWNGKDNNGNNVASGLYLCRITSTGKHESRKMLLLK